MNGIDFQGLQIGDRWIAKCPNCQLVIRVNAEKLSVRLEKDCHWMDKEYMTYVAYDSCPRCKALVRFAQEQ